MVGGVRVPRRVADLPVRFERWLASVARVVGPICATGTEGPITEGGTISLVSTVNPKRTFRLEVTEMTAPTRMVWSDGMPLGLFKGVRTYQLIEQGDSTEFSMTEEFSGLLSGHITKAIPDMTESFNQFANGLKAAAEAPSG